MSSNLFINFTYCCANGLTDDLDLIVKLGQINVDCYNIVKLSNIWSKVAYLLNFNLKDREGSLNSLKKRILYNAKVLINFFDCVTSATKSRSTFLCLKQMKINSLIVRFLSFSTLSNFIGINFDMCEFRKLNNFNLNSLFNYAREWAKDNAISFFISTDTVEKLNNTEIKIDKEIREHFNEIRNLEEINIVRSKDDLSVDPMIIPLEVKYMQKVTTFIMLECGIRFIPHELCRMASLAQLNLSHNNLKTLPVSISSLTNLNTLVLANNQFKMIPSGIYSLKNLRALNLSTNYIKGFSSDISKLINLESLDVCKNILLHSFCDFVSLKKITSLKHLNIDINSKLRSVPEADITPIVDKEEALAMPRLIPFRVWVAHLERGFDRDLEVKIPLIGFDCPPSLVFDAFSETVEQDGMERVKVRYPEISEDDFPERKKRKFIDFFT